MAVHFHPLRIKEITKETDDCVSICFDVPQELKQEYIFKEGQNITLKKEIDGEECRRSYSLCVAPHEGLLKVAIKKVLGGKFSSFANDALVVGDVIDVMPPTGRFHVKATDGQYLMIAAGSGITPVLSIIKHLLFTQTTADVTLVYGNQDRKSIIFFEEIEAIKNKYMQRFSCIYTFSREHTDSAINYGRISEEKLNDLQSVIPYATLAEAFICGPEEMIFSAAAFLEKKGMSKENIHFELFTTPGSKTEKKVVNNAVADDAPKAKVIIRLDGRSTELAVAYEGDSILDVALKSGADLPFACKGGVCCTCRAKLVKGEVTMDVNYALEKEEVEQGFILTCQSHPVTEEVVIDFDLK